MNQSKRKYTPAYYYLHSYNYQTMSPSKLCVNLFPGDVKVKTEIESPTKQFSIPFLVNSIPTPLPSTQTTEITPHQNQSSVSLGDTISPTHAGKKTPRAEFRGKCKNCFKKDLKIEKLTTFNNVVAKKGNTLRMDSMDISSFLF